MDAEKRREVAARREALKGRISREEQRGALWGDDELLAAAGTPFRLRYRDEEDRPDWLAGLVPAGLFHLDWARIEHVHECVFERERVDFARAALAARLGPDDLLWVVPGNGLAPIIEISRAGFDQHAAMLMEIDREMWLSGAPSWLIEFRKSDVRMIG
jgi:hypothetical protein